MKKLIQSIFCYKNIEVYNVDTGKAEIAQYRMIFGFICFVSYKPLIDENFVKKSINKTGEKFLEKIKKSTMALE